MQLGKAVGILVLAEAAENFAHADVEAFGAPGECHALVTRGQKERQRRARKHAEAVARMPLRVILRKASKLGYQQCGPLFNRVYARVYANNFPF